jgi:5'-nucleotidase
MGKVYQQRLILCKRLLGRDRGAPRAGVRAAAAGRAAVAARARIWWVLVVCLAFAWFVLPGGVQAQAGFELTILHTNDTHGRLQQVSRSGSRCTEGDAAEDRCFGGVARRATAIERVRGEGGPVILLDGGDQFQGTLFYTLYKGDEAQQFLNLLGYAAMAVGNHEFDDGPENLARFAAGLDLPLVSANIDVSGEPTLSGLIRPYAVLEVAGERIGVVGFTTEDTAILSSPGPNVRFYNIEKTVAAAVSELERQGIDKIVAVSHAGYARDQQVAANVAGIDVIVGGHTNTYLANDDPAATGPYPTVVTSPRGDPVLIVSAFAYGVFLGRLDVTFDDAGVAVAWAGAPILLDAAIPEDPAVLAQVEELAIPLEALRQEVVGETTGDLDGDRGSCRFYECTMGNLVADAMIWQTASEGVQIAIQNGGGLRTSLPAGPISLGDILEVLPFSNNIATLELRGADVRAALENGVSRALSVNNEGTGRFPQVAGLRYAWDPDRPPGARILSVDVRNADGSYTPLDPAAIYKVATNDFLRRGGDGYSVFAEQAINAYDAGDNLEEAVAAYVRAHSPITPKLEGRVTRAAQSVNLPLMVGLGMAALAAVAAGGWVLAGGNSQASQSPPESSG